MSNASDPGVWLTRRVPRLAYWAIPKCGCSSIKQVLHFLDNGAFYPGYIHDPRGPLLNSLTGEGRVEIARLPVSEPPFSFTFARNPYSRLASCFADKIVGFPAGGRRYRLGAVHEHLGPYGIEWGPKADIAANFRRFVRFVADTVFHGRPMPADQHWMPGVLVLRNRAADSPQWPMGFVGHVENFKHDIDRVYRLAGIKSRRAPRSVPRANESSLFGLPLAALYGPTEIAMVQEIYEADFRLFHYTGRLDQLKPTAAIDRDEIDAAIGQPTTGARVTASPAEVAEVLPTTPVDRHL